MILFFRHPLFIMDSLEYVIKTRHLEKAKKLAYEKGNLDNELNLIVQAADGNLEKVKYLVEELGVDIHIQNELPLLWAADNHHYEVVKFLIKKGANIHVENEEVLLSVAIGGNLEMVKYLVEELGADIHAHDEIILTWAAEYGHDDIVDYLIKKGADIDIALSNCDDEAISSLTIYKKQYIKIEMYKGHINNRTETDCGVCLLEMNSIKQKIVQCKTCKKCIHYKCHLKVEDMKCIYCRN